MKNRNRIIAVLLAAALMVCCLSGCSSANSKIQDTLDEFAYACRNLDADALLDCIAPDVADPIRLGLALFSGAMGQDYEDVTDDILEQIVYAVFGEDFDPDDFLKTISVSDVKISTSGDTAEVRCVISFEVAGENFVRQSSIIMVEQLDKWYIAYIDLFA